MVDENEDSKTSISVKLTDESSEPFGAATMVYSQKPSSPPTPKVDIPREETVNTKSAISIVKPIKVEEKKSPLNLNEESLRPWSSEVQTPPAPSLNAGTLSGVYDSRPSEQTRTNHGGFYMPPNPISSPKSSIPIQWIAIGLGAVVVVVAVKILWPKKTNEATQAREVVETPIATPSQNTVPDQGPNQTALSSQTVSNPGTWTPGQALSMLDQAMQKTRSQTSFRR